MERIETPLNGSNAWVDISGPQFDDLRGRSQKFDLPLELMRDCLGPKHLPKSEKVGDAHWIVVRWYDPKAAPEETSFRELTHKLVIFWKNDRILTIHRKKFPFLQAVQGTLDANASPAGLFLRIFQQAIESYQNPLEAIEDRLEGLESTALDEHPQDRAMLEFHRIRNRLTTFKRLFWHTLSAFQKLDVSQDRALRSYQRDIREQIDQILFQADELLDDTNSLMNLELSLAAQRTNHVIRILTIFSVFFLPLTFIVGIYGMNFERMPELSWAYGYPFSWILMAVVTTGIWAWFRRNRWL